MAGVKKRLLTGLQSSGRLHIGNYFGTLVRFRAMYTEYESFLMVVDYHSLTSVRNGDEMRQNTYNAVKDYLALGIDPTQCIMFKQSDVPEHTEMAWIFDCLVTVPFLMLGHAYKDKVAKGLEPSAGLLTYPMLMAADILLYDTDVVPVGEDQRQHVEYAREAAAKFNAAYGATFKEPKESIQKEVAVVPGIDGQKMAKSRPQYSIPIFAERDEIAKRVMAIVTDSSGQMPTNVYAIHKLYRPESELTSIYESKKGKYKELKEILIEDMNALAAPMREKRASITDEDVKGILKEGGEKARAIASVKMIDVRRKVGVSL
jgi:tryptophanyl-tRNA synthetase